MARPRSDKRDKAFEIWRDSGQTMKLKDIADELDIPASRIRKWKAEDKWEEKIKGAFPNTKGSAPKRRGAPKGSKNARGHGAPEGNKNSEKHGFFAKIFPDDPEIREIIGEIGAKSPLDILWENIVIQYTAIARAQRIMFVQSKGELIKHLKREKKSSGPQSDSWEKEYELQFAWDRQASFLAAQARAMTTLEKLLSRYESMASDEQLLKVEKLKHDMQLARERLKLEKSKAFGDEEDTADDGFIDALRGKAGEAWDGFAEEN